MRHETKPSLIQIVACRLVGDISTTTKFGKGSAELIIMTGELISVSHARRRPSCQSFYLLRYPLGFQWSPSM